MMLRAFKVTPFLNYYHNCVFGGYLKFFCFCEIILDSET